VVQLLAIDELHSGGCFLEKVDGGGIAFEYSFSGVMFVQSEVELGLEDCFYFDLVQGFFGEELYLLFRVVLDGFDWEYLAFSKNLLEKVVSFGIC
jgi:hypothetical protein